MIVTDARPGDQYVNEDGTLGYTVKGTRTEQHPDGSSWIVLEVEYVDGGDGYRAFPIADEVPLTAPKQGTFRRGDQS